MSEENLSAPVAAQQRGGITQWVVSKLPYLHSFKTAMVVILLTTLYWGIFASDRYVSEAHVVIEQTDISVSQGTDLTSILLTGGKTNPKDQMFLRDHLLSMDMMNLLDEKLHLRAHYSDTKQDIFSRMWSEDLPQERFQSYFLTRVEVLFDDTSGISVIRSQAFTPEMAHLITSQLVEEGERFMNEMAHRLAREQLIFLEKQVAQVSERFKESRQKLLAFQDSKGLVSPKGTVESLSAVVSRLEGQQAELEAKRHAMLGYLSARSPNVAQLDLQINAIAKQILQEQSRLASPEATTLNRTLEEFQVMQMEVEFAQNMYRTALSALEKGRVEAIRTLKMVSVLQKPTMAQYPMEPRRIYYSILFALTVLMAMGTSRLIGAIIRDHKD